MKHLILSALSALARRPAALPTQTEWNERMTVAAWEVAEFYGGRDLTHIERRFFLEGYHGRIPRPGTTPEQDANAMMKAIMEKRSTRFSMFYFHVQAGARSVQRFTPLI